MHVRGKLIYFLLSRACLFSAEYFSSEGSFSELVQGNHVDVEVLRGCVCFWLIFLVLMCVSEEPRFCSRYHDVNC